jgi:hypothetical protein
MFLDESVSIESKRVYRALVPCSARNYSVPTSEELYERRHAEVVARHALPSGVNTVVPRAPFVEVEI